MEETKVPVPARILLRPEDSPGYRSNPNPIRLTANFYRFSLTGSRLGLQKHSVDFEPDVPAQISRTREAILRRIAIPIREMLGRFVFANTVLYSVSQQTSSEESFTLSTNYNNIDYQITFTPVGTVNSNEELKAFYNKFFNFIQGKLQLVMIGRRFYDPERRMVLQGRDIHIEIWPGYVSSVSNYQAGCLLNVDVAHRCVSTVTVLEQIDELKRKYPREFLNEANRRFSNSIVLTRYNRKPYHVDHIDWDANPESTFIGSDGETTYIDYYQRKYGQRINCPEQPLLEAIVNKNKIYLIPEFCVMTGISEELRYKVNKETRKSPYDRLKETSKLLNSALNDPKVQREINEWRVSLDREPLLVDASLLPIGNINLGNNKSFKLNMNNPNFNDKIDTAMLSKVPLNSWAIFYQTSDESICRKLLGRLENVLLKQFEFSAQSPEHFKVPTADYGEESKQWGQVFQNNVSSIGEKQLILCILPSQRSDSKLYDNIKKFTLSTISVPSQIVLARTLQNDKILNSVVTKIAIQINAKVGGIPWVISNIPLNDIPTMIVGIDVYHKKGSPSVLGFCATTDESFSRYTSTARVQMESQEITGLLREPLTNSIQQFKNIHKRSPGRIIIFRDGVSDSMIPILRVTEVDQIKSTFQELVRTRVLDQEPKLCFIVVNKRVNARFYSHNGGRIDNPPVGACIDSYVTKESGNDFYLVSTKTAQGVVTPTHFNIVYDDTEVNFKLIQELAYKLSYMYYNWCGPIKVPAPCMYAHKLAYLYGERISKLGEFPPHSDWSHKKLLYFL
jgi:aubergine-like protein